jgi:hypothetical protein
MIPVSDSGRLRDCTSCSICIEVVPITANRYRVDAYPRSLVKTGLDLMSGSAL